MRTLVLGMYGVPGGHHLGGGRRPPTEEVGIGVADSEQTPRRKAPAGGTGRPQHGTIQGALRAAWKGALCQYPIRTLLNASAGSPDAVTQEMPGPTNTDSRELTSATVGKARNMASPSKSHSSPRAVCRGNKPSRGRAVRASCHPIADGRRLARLLRAGNC